MFKAILISISLLFVAISSNASQIGEQDLGHPEILSRQFTMSYNECMYTFKEDKLVGEFSCRLIIPQAEYGTIYDPNTATNLIVQSGRCNIYFVVTQEGINMKITANKTGIGIAALTNAEAKACLAAAYAKEKIADKIFNINIMVLRK